MNKFFKWDDTDGPMVVMASNSLEAHKIFGGKTLKMVGKEHELGDEDVRFAITELKDGREIKHLSVTIDNVEYVIPFSRGAKADELTSLKTCLDGGWLFRTGFMSRKLDNGEQMRDPETDEIMLDESKPYMSFGLAGLNITRRESAWEDSEPSEEDLEADAAGVAKAAPMTQKEKIAAAKAKAAAK